MSLIRPQFRQQSSYIHRISRATAQHSLVLLCLLAAIAAIYVPTLEHTFLYWDDQYYITSNPYITQPSWPHAGELLTKAISLNYHPLTMLSLWLNAYWSGSSDATPYIATNIGLHTANSLLVYLLAYRLSTKNMLVALTTACIFALHPMHVESVSWISERKDVLYTFFFLSAAISYLQWLRSYKSTWVIIATVLFTLSCLSKAMAVSLVPVLFLLDLYQGQKWKMKRLLVAKIPFLLIGVLTGLIALDVQAGGDFYGYLSNTDTAVALAAPENLDFWTKVKNVGFGLYFYLERFVWPHAHSAYHPYSLATDHTLYHYMWLCPLALGGLLLYALTSGKKHLLLGLGWFVATIALVLQWIPVGTAIVADRYSYLPYLGLGLLVGQTLSTVGQVYGHKLAWGLLIAIGLCSTKLSQQQAQQWQDHTTLFSQTTEQYPADGKSRLLLATGLWMQGNNAEAIQQLEVAINELGLYNSDVFEKLATCYTESGEPAKGLAFYNHSIKLDSLNYVARYHRGLVLMESDPEAAISDFNYCERSGFEFFTQAIYSPRGRCYGLLGRYEEAILDFTKAIELGLDLPHNYTDRATTYQLMGDSARAAADFAKANTYKTQS